MTFEVPDAVGATTAEPARCRVCGKSVRMRMDGVVGAHEHGGRRCSGYLRPPAGESPCGMFCTGIAGRVSWPAEYEPGKPHASTLVCHDPEHQGEAREWVRQVTGHEGVLLPVGRR
jgi:hypothetical protein